MSEQLVGREQQEERPGAGLPHPPLHLGGLEAPAPWLALASSASFPSPASTWLASPIDPGTTTGCPVSDEPPVVRDRAERPSLHRLDLDEVVATSHLSVAA